MSEVFNFNEVEDFQGRIEPGIEECEITGIIEGENQNGKKYLEIGFITLDGSRKHSEKFYMSSDKAVKMTLLRIKHLIKTLKGEDAANKSYSIEGLNKILTGLKGRFVFYGEEYMYEGEIRVRTSLAFFGFVEKLSVPKEESTLKYDKENPNHFKKIKKVEIDDGDDEEGDMSEETF